MIVQEILTAPSNDPRDGLDAILARCCEMVLDGQAADPDFYGMVGSCVVCPDGSLVYGINYEAEDGRRVHAERAALERCGNVSPECIIVTTLSPCNTGRIPNHKERYGEDCQAMLDEYGIEHVYCGYKNPEEDHDDSIETNNPKLQELCKKFADTFLKESVTEAFDQPYPMTWEHSEESHDALVKLPDGTNLSIMFSMDYGAYGDEEWQVEFWRNNSQDVTGEGDAQRVFATVLTAIQQFIKQYSPERIRFSATKEDDAGNSNQSRSSLYTKLVKRYANSWGYSVDVSDHSGTVVYELINDLNEVTLVPTVAKSKREHLDVMPNDGRPIPRGEEAEHLGKLIADVGNGYQVWSWTDRGTVTYYVFDTNTRTSQLGTTGRPYKTNRDSFVVQGVYSGPKNRFRAADLYAFLILDQGLTLISDNKQSEGGYRVWQELEQRYKEINVHGFDTKTDQGVNVTTQDEPDTHVDRATVKKAGPKMKKELGSISRDLRFVASKK